MYFDPKLICTLKPYTSLYLMRLHQFDSKESGLMIIGSATELRELGEQLQKLTDGKPELSREDWPPLLVSHLLHPDTGFSLSFHIDTESHKYPATNLPENEMRKSFFFAIEMIGFYSLMRWMFSFFQ